MEPIILQPLVFEAAAASRLLHPTSSSSPAAETLHHTRLPLPPPLQPTVVAVCCGAYIEQWHLYKAGIMDASMQCTRPLDHSVLVVGYDTDAATGQA